MSLSTLSDLVSELRRDIQEPVGLFTNRIKGQQLILGMGGNCGWECALVRYRFASGDDGYLKITSYIIRSGTL